MPIPRSDSRIASSAGGLVFVGFELDVEWPPLVVVTLPGSVVDSPTLVDDAEAAVVEA